MASPCVRAEVTAHGTVVVTLSRRGDRLPLSPCQEAEGGPPARCCHRPALWFRIRPLSPVPCARDVPLQLPASPPCPSGLSCGRTARGQLRLRGGRWQGPILAPGCLKVWVSPWGRAFKAPRSTVSLSVVTAPSLAPDTGRAAHHPAYQDPRPPLSGRGQAGAVTQGSTRAGGDRETGRVPGRRVTPTPGAPAALEPTGAAPRPPAPCGPPPPRSGPARRDSGASERRSAVLRECPGPRAR